MWRSCWIRISCSVRNSCCIWKSRWRSSHDYGHQPAWGLTGLLSTQIHPDYPEFLLSYLVMAVAGPQWLQAHGNLVACWNPSPSQPSPVVTGTSTLLCFPAAPCVLPDVTEHLVVPTTFRGSALHHQQAGIGCDGAQWDIWGTGWHGDGDNILPIALSRISLDAPHGKDLVQWVQFSEWVTALHRGVTSKLCSIMEWGPKPSAASGQAQRDRVKALYPKLPLPLSQPARWSHPAPSCCSLEHPFAFPSAHPAIEVLLLGADPTQSNPRAHLGAGTPSSTRSVAAGTGCCPEHSGPGCGAEGGTENQAKCCFEEWPLGVPAAPCPACIEPP